MSLMPQSITALAETDVIGSGKNIVAGASVNITKAGGGSATIYSDAAGSSVITLPTVTDSSGEMRFYIESGSYIYTIAGSPYPVFVSDKNHPVIIETWADIATVTPTAAGQLFTLKQHTSGGLGGGTLMAFVGSVTDDGGTKKNCLGGFYLKRIHFTELSQDDFGAVADGITDDLAKLTALATACSSYKCALRLSRGVRCATGNTLDLSNVPFVHSDNAFILPSFDGVAVRYLGAQGGLIEDLRISGMLNVEWANVDWTKNRVGFFFQNVYNSNFNISVRKSTVGIKCRGYDSGCVQNNFHLGSMYLNNVGVWLSSEDGDGWCNMNRFHGGFFYGSKAVSGSLYQSIASHIYVESSPYTNNGNIFLYPSTEWVSLDAGFRLARLGGTRNKLLIGYAESNGFDSTWFVDNGVQNTIDAQNAPYAIGYDPELPGSANRIDVSAATMPSVIGPQKFIDFGGEGSQYYRGDSSTRSPMDLSNTDAAALRLRRSTAGAALEIYGGISDTTPRVAIPAAGHWTVFNGSIHVIWNQVVAPTSGTWNRGDIAWNVEPSALGFVGWICVSAGTPGTWKTFGSISA